MHSSKFLPIQSFIHYKEMAKLRLTYSVILLLFTVTELLWLVKMVQTTSNGVCYRTRTTHRTAYRSESYSQSYRCGTLNWRRCRRTLYRPVSFTQTTYSRDFDCCSGYRRCGTSLRSCCPVCNPPCTNGGTCNRPYTCNCLPGWTGNACQTDINECIGTNRCQQVCVNTLGSYVCRCRAGYRLNNSDGYTCTDINECSRNIDRCHQNCHNAVGSYACSCNTGYRLGQDGITCIDIDECGEGTDQCDQQCYNIVGSYSCSCTETGYRLHSNDATCQNIDECIEGADGCAQICTDTEGSYICSCSVGYELANDQYGCDDIDECQENIPSCNQVCSNINGSYLCSCHPGYRLDSDGYNCTILDGVPFQVRFFLSTGSEDTCLKFVNETSEGKTNALAIAISQQISKICNCSYLESYIYGHQFFCHNSILSAIKTVIYQAKFLVVNGTTSRSIQNTIQNWMLSGSFIMIDGQQYQLDSSCSVVIEEVGDTSCDAIQPVSSADSQVNLLYYYAGGGGGALLVLLIAIGMITTVCVIKQMSKKSRYSVRQSCAAQTELVDQNPSYCAHQFSTYQGIGGKHFQEEQKPEYYECPTSLSQDGGHGNYELPLSMHRGGGHNDKKRIQPDPECYKHPLSSGENVIDTNSNVYESVY